MPARTNQGFLLGNRNSVIIKWISRRKWDHEEYLKTFILLAGLTALFLFIGQALGGRSGFKIALFFAVIMNFVSYWFSDKIALAMSGAQPVSENEAPALYGIIRELCQRAELPLPRLYVINSPTPNAFATGRNLNMRPWR